MGLGLKVPVHVDALVVTAETARDRKNQWGSATDRPPLENAPALPVGVHLNWALPDGLTRGESVEEGERVVRVDFPAAPDLWLVVRYDPRPRQGRSRACQAWVVDAWRGTKTPLADWQPPPPQARPARLTAAGFQGPDGAMYDEPPGPDGAAAANGKAGPGFAAYYRNTPTRFGFHDDLSGITSGAVSYLVVGWYSDLAVDPLHAAGGVAGRTQWVDDRGWFIEHPIPALQDDVHRPPLDFERVGDLIAILDTGRDPLDPRAPWDPLGPRTPFDPLGPTGPTGPQGPTTPTGPTPARPVRPGGPFDPRDRLTPAQPEEPAVTPRRPGQPAEPRRPRDPRLGGLIAATTPTDPRQPRDTVIAAATTPGGPVTLAQNARLEKFGGHGDTLSLSRKIVHKDILATSRYGFLLGTGGLVLNPFEPPYPDRIFCHGLVVNVVLGRRTVDTTERTADTPKVSAIEAVVAGSAAEAIARLLAPYPELIPIVEALHAGLLRELASDEGLRRLPQLLHQAGFGATAGAPIEYYVVERVPATKLPKRPDGGLTGLAAAAVDKGAGFGDASSREVALKDVPRSVSRFAIADRQVSSLVADRFVQQGHAAPKWLDRNRVEDLLKTPGPDGTRLRLRHVRVPSPRFWQADPPVLLLQGPRRSFRHGHDGRFDADGRLICRTTGQTVLSLAANLRAALSDARHKDLPETTPVRATDVLVPPEELRGVAPTIRELIEEGALLDPSNAALFATVAKERYKLDDTETGRLAAAFEVETQYWWSAALPGVDAAAVAEHSLYAGVLPSPIAVKPHRHCWAPLFVEWEAELHPRTQNLKAGWTLGEVEHAPRGTLLSAASPIVARGRMWPTDLAGRTLAGAMLHLADGEDDQIGLSNSAQAALRALSERLDRLDLLSGALDGVDQAFVAAGHSLRAGTLKLSRVRLVDTFGQLFELPAAKLQAATGDRVSVTGGAAGHLLLPPRLPYPSRVMFRLMAGEGGTAEADLSATAVCGWFMPDHVEHAMEVFSSPGEAVGQLRHIWGTPHFVWETSPGTEPVVGARASEIENPYLRGVVQGLLDWDQKTPDDAPESALAAFLRVIDTVQHTVDRAGDSDEFLATLVGRPVALVRARVLFETDPPSAPAGLTPPAGLEARLGTLTQGDDGLLGYFLGGDYGTFYPPHAVVRTNARKSGPRQGWLAQTGGTVSDRHWGEIQHALVVKDGSFLHVDPTVDLVPGQALELLLVMDPRAGVHVTTGVLPRKRIALDREQVEAALARIAPTFRVGPVLLDPSRLALPAPALERHEWLWTRRERPPAGADGWSATPVQPSSDAAEFGDRPARIHEGWLRLAPKEKH
jgi:hypothetical protein